MSKNPTAAQILSMQRTKNSLYWEKIRETKSLSLFRDAAKNVPAYKDFLKKNKIKVEKIKSWNDFVSVPPVNKNNYLRKYPLESLCWGGKLNKPLIYTSTSGSTGDPVFFVRSQKLDWQYSVLLENYLRRRVSKRKGSTLVIVCFGMGIWIGGIITYKAFEMAAQRSDLPVSIITPGLKKDDIISYLKKLSPKYESTILAGYPPFIKDIIDEASDSGIDLPSLNIQVLFAAEAITEEFRNYLQNKLAMKNIFLDTMSIYGSADIGAMAEENPTSILVKRLAIENKDVFSKLFLPINKTPTLAQFNPYFINFESMDDQIYLTGDSAMPLVRYGIGDTGGVFTFDEMKNGFGKQKISIKKEAQNAKISEYLYELPFVYVYERVDLSTTFYGLWIYPEWLRASLLENPLQDHITGKFTLLTKYDKNKDQYLELNIELRKGKKPFRKLEREIMKKIVSALRNKSSEYTEISNQFGERAYPKIILWPAGHPEHFMPGIKQKWVKK